MPTGPKPAQISNFPPIDLHLIFEKSSLNNQVGETFCLFWTWILQATQAVKIQFENQVCPTWFFKLNSKIKWRSIGGEWGSWLRSISKMVWWWKLLPRPATHTFVLTFPSFLILWGNVLKLHGGFSFYIL